MATKLPVYAEVPEEEEDTGKRRGSKP